MVEQNTVYLDTESTHRIMDGTASGSAKGSIVLFQLYNIKVCFDTAIFN